MNSLPHVHEDFRPVVSLTDHDRIQFINDTRWIGYETAHKALDSMCHLMRLEGSSTSMQNLLVVAESNNGKTSIMERFKEICGQPYVNQDAEPVKPVILTESTEVTGESGQKLVALS